MEINILTYKKLKDNQYWILGSSKLVDYLKAIDKNPEEKFNFEIQRKIVKNIYLDKILDTLQKEEPLPFITLASSIHTEPLSKDKPLKLNHFDIIDGLQRSYRLWAYWEVYKSILKNPDSNDLKQFLFRVKEKYPHFFKNNVLNSKVLKKLFSIRHDLERIFKEYEIFFVIWINLTEKEIIRKMLVLNAGQKPVSSRHQFELIFLHIEKELQNFLKGKGIKIYREKDPNFNRLKKERQPGEYTLVSLVTALLSLVTAKPQRVSSELIYKYDLVEDERTIDYAEDVFSKEFIKTTLLFLLKLDKKYINDHKALVWLGKDTTLTGIFAAIGKHIGITKLKSTSSHFPKEKVKQTFQNLVERLPENLNLDSFNYYYDSLAGKSVNIGMFIRKVIQYYALSLLQGNPISWERAFSTIEEGAIL